MGKTNSPLFANALTAFAQEFNEHFTGIVPEQGVSRLVSSHRTQQSESFLRRGLAAIFEHGFMSTPQGRANYFLTLAQIARAVQETTNFGVIYAYLTCHNYAKQWVRECASILFCTTV